MGNEILNIVKMELITKHVDRLKCHKKNKISGKVQELSNIGELKWLQTVIENLGIMDSNGFTTINSEINN